MKKLNWKPKRKRRIKKTIAEYVIDFLSANNIITCKYDEALVKVCDINYEDIKQRYQLNNEKDIIWMKFTTDGYLGVVAVSNDVNFDIPETKEQYDEKIWNDKKQEEEWKWNSAGILVHKLGKQWDTKEVLIFPLKNIPQKYNRHDIEKAVGNYLIKAKKVPIIDYYSHMYGRGNK